MLRGGKIKLSSSNWVIVCVLKVAMMKVRMLELPESERFWCSSEWLPTLTVPSTRSRWSVSLVGKMSVLRSRKEEEGEKLEIELAEVMILVSTKGAKNLPRFLASWRLKPAERPAQIKTEVMVERGSVMICFTEVSFLGS